MMMKILNLICTEARAVQSLLCHVNGALQKKRLIEIVPNFIDCKSLFQDAFDYEEIAHGTKWARIRCSIQDLVENDIPLPADITKLQPQHCRRLYAVCASQERRW